MKKLLTLSLIVSAAWAPWPAAAQGHCNELRALAQKNWALFNHYRDPAHRAAAQNYENAFTASCTGRPSAPTPGGATGAGRAADIAGAMVGIMGIIAALALTPEDVSVGPRPSDDRMQVATLQRLREDAQREQEDARRRCALANPFGGAGKPGCGPEQNPFRNPPYWDSVKKRDCAGTIDFSKDGCVPDYVREVIADLRGQSAIVVPKQRAQNYGDAVLSVEQYRRLGAGESFEGVVGVNAVSMPIAQAFVRKLRERERAIAAATSTNPFSGAPFEGPYPKDGGTSVPWSERPRATPTPNPFSDSPEPATPTPVSDADFARIKSGAVAALYALGTLEASGRLPSGSAIALHQRILAQLEQQRKAGVLNVPITLARLQKLAALAGAPPTDQPPSDVKSDTRPNLGSWRFCGGRAFADDAAGRAAYEACANTRVETPTTNPKAAALVDELAATVVNQKPQTMNLGDFELIDSEEFLRRLNIYYGP